MPANKGKLLGTMMCPHCGETRVEVRRSNTNGFAYYHCPKEPDGCGSQYFSRSAVSSKNVVKQIDQWVDAKTKKEFLGEPPKKTGADTGKLPEKPEKPETKKTDDSSKADVPWYDRPLWGKGAVQ